MEGKRTCFQPNKTRDITGEKFHSLTAICFDHRDNRYTGGAHFWRFRCDCGNEIVARKNAVVSGNTKWCPKCSRNRHAKMVTKHGMHDTRLYREWAGIIQRCTNPNSTSWDRYGGKGISVCDEWKRFEPFAEWALENGYSDDLTIDRIDSKGNYEPSNCRWATIREQANNKADTLWILYNGVLRPLSMWSEMIGIKYHTLYDRLFTYGWTVEKAFETPVDGGKQNDNGRQDKADVG